MLQFYEAVTQNAAQMQSGQHVCSPDSTCVHCIQKVFPALHIYHILLCDSLIPGLIKSIFYPQNSTHNIHHGNAFFFLFSNVLN